MKIAHFSPLSRALQLNIVKICFLSQNFDFYKNSQNCLISSTVLQKHILDVPKHFGSFLWSYNRLSRILRKNEFFEFFRFFFDSKSPFLHCFWRKAHHMRSKNIFFENSRCDIKNRASRGFYIMLWHYARQRGGHNSTIWKKS